MKQGEHRGVRARGGRRGRRATDVARSASDVRILLAEDHDIVREGLRSLIDASPGYVVVAEAATGTQAIALAASADVQVAVLDINLPEINGIEVARRLQKEVPAVRLVGLSVHTGGRFVDEMLKAGCLAYLPKSCAARELFVAIDAALRGDVYVSPEIDRCGANASGLGPRTQALNPLASLSSREREILQLFAEGRSTKEIAAVLALAVVTIHSHRQAIMRKLKCGSVVEMTRLAIREGLTSVQ
jgi:two-component system response regulator NreC